MSGRLSNLSFNLVDWKIREQILGVAPDQLESLLCALELPPATDDDRARVKRLDAKDFPWVVYACSIGQGLRVDRRRFAARAVDLWKQDPDSCVGTWKSSRSSAAPRACTATCGSFIPPWCCAAAMRA